MTRPARVAGALIAVMLAVMLLAGAGSGRTQAPRPAHADATARLAAAGTGAGEAALPPVDPDQYAACAADSTYGSPPEPAVSSVAGWSDASKLGGSVAPGFPVPAVAENVGTGEGFQTSHATVDGQLYVCDRATVQLNYQGQREFPPVRATFLAFGFVPVTATAYLIQAGPGPVTSVFYQDATAPYGTAFGPDTGVVTSAVLLRIADVTVNGVPLNVGGNCQTTGPLYSPPSSADPDPATNPLLVLVGGDQPADPAPYYDPVNGGALVGEATIPPFSGCATPGGEDLDALLDSSVSGSGNYLRIEQGPGCFGTNGAVCAALLDPYPGPLWTVTDGGLYTGSPSGPVTVDSRNIFGNGLVITCAVSGIAGNIPKADGPPRGAQATLAWTSLSGCAGTDYTSFGRVANPYGTWTVTQADASTPGFYEYQSASGTVEGEIYVTLSLTAANLPGTPVSCAAQAAGAISMAYSDSSSVLASQANANLTITSSTCSLMLAGAGPRIDFSYQLSRHVKIVSP